ncbi:MAG: methionyl-tRNA formyltransferase [Bacteroidales bacterium]
MKIVFMGTPEFAVATLDAIRQTKHEIVGVVTTPDKPAGRGQQLHFSEVKKYALEYHLPLFQPEKLKDPLFLNALQELNADLFVVVAFRMLPEAVYSMPQYGTFNVHASLLPNYRGAAPIHRAIMNGEHKSGVTTFFLNNHMDTGDMSDQTEITVGDDETTGELYERLMVEGAKLAIRTIQSIEDGTIKTISQDHIDEKKLLPAPKIFKEDTLIDWGQSAKLIFNKIRGLSPYPGAYTRIASINGDIHTIKCFKASIVHEKSTEEPGTVQMDKEKNIYVCTADFLILLQNIQLQGRKRMNSPEFIQGFHPENYTLKLF